MWRFGRHSERKKRKSPFLTPHSHLTHSLQRTPANIPIQESCAIAKMTAQCAYTWVPWIFSGLPDYAHGDYFQRFSWAFVRIDPTNVPTKFEVRSFTRSWDNRGTPKNWAVPGYAHASFSPKFLMSFYSDCIVNVPAKFEVRSITRSRDNRGYPKNLGSHWIRPRFLFSKFLMGFYFD